jgi:hypothetical protein
MAPIVRNATTDAVDNTPTVSPAKPGGLTTGDLLVCFQSSDSDGSLASMTAPDGGWIQLVGFGTSPCAYVKVWRKIATTADVAKTTFGFPDHTGANCVAALLAIQAGTFNAGNPTGDVQSAFSSTNANNHPAPSVAGVAGGLLLTGHTGNSSGTERVYTQVPSGMTEVAQDYTSYVPLVVYKQDLTVTGPTGTKTAGLFTGNIDWNAVALVINGGVAITATVGLVQTPTLSAGAVGSGAVRLVQTPTIGVVAGRNATVGLTQTPTITLNSRLILQQATFGLTQLPLISVTSRTIHFPPVVLTQTATLEIFGRLFRPPVIRTVYPYPAPEYPFRLIAQNILTGEIVDWDLPVQDDFEYEHQLSGPTIMKGSFRPEIQSIQELNLDGYAYYLHVEVSGEVRASAILLPPQYDDESGLVFTAEGFSSAPHYMIYQGQLSDIDLDPLDVVRNIWNYVQSQPESNYGVTVSNTTSPTKLGEGATTEDIEGSDGTVTTREVAAKPYELVWWEAVNCGQEIDTLLKLTPADYKERVAWNENKTDVLFYVDLGYPRLGQARSDLLFNEENIHELVPIEEDPDTYASEVIVVGAGEGIDTIRGYASMPYGGRVRKSVVITDKTVKDTQRANALAAEELGIRRGRTFEVSEITISAHHPNASIGSYDVGDDIVVSVDVPWLVTTITAWYRIMSMRYRPAGRHVVLELKRTESFRDPSVGR